ncbi:MAG: protein kinase [Gemmatimonadota bacterium]
MNAIAQLSAHLAGRYNIEREIGEGGMATVYLARDLRHERRVALKVLKPELAAVLGGERFFSEIRVTANLQHPNLLPLFDSGEANGLLFYVMPFVDGESLRARLDREGQLPVDEATRIAVAVASALEYAHAQGVIHRDLKPENILLQSGQPVVADFGIALAISNAGGARITQTGLSLGTPQYMSPEQATGDRVDARSDIYSLAAVTYEMLAGEAAHTGNTAQAIIARVLTEQPRSLRSTRPHLPEHVEVAVTKALSKLPADRWASASQFADALQGKLALDRHTTATLRTPRGSRFQDPVFLAVLLAAVLGTGFGVWSLTRGRTSDEDSVIREELTFQEGEGLAPAASIAISPDGRSIVYNGVNAAGERVLFLRELSQLTARELPGTQGASQFVLSPNGEWVGYLRRGEVHKVNVTTGANLQVTPAISSIVNLGWSARDLIVAAIGPRLHTIPAGGGEPQPLIPIDSAGGEIGQRGPRVLDDGETVLFRSWRGTERESRLGIVSLKTGEVSYVEFPDAAPIGVVDGNLIYATVADALMAVPFDVAARKVTGTPVPLNENVLVTGQGYARASLSASGSLVYRTGTSTGQLIHTDSLGAITTLLAEPRYYFSPRLSPDGKRIAYSSRTATSQLEIWIYDIAAKTPTLLTTAGGPNERPEWSPDGQTVLFISSRSGAPALWRQNADFSDKTELLQSKGDGSVGAGLLSPDGQFLVYRISGPGRGLWYRRLTGDTVSKPLSGTEASAIAPKFSADGKWIAYSSSQNGPPQVFVQPFPPTGARHQVSNEGGGAPVWSRDGRRIYFINGPRLFSANLVTTPALAVTSRDTLFQSVFLSVWETANYDAAPNGGLIWMRSPSPNEQTIFVHNFKSELRKRMGVKR